MRDVIVPFELRDHAPLQSQRLAQDFGKPLQPQLQLTAAPSPVAQASISQQPPPLPPATAAAIWMLVALESPGLTPGLSVHSCVALLALQGTAAKLPPAASSAAATLAGPSPRSTSTSSEGTARLPSDQSGAGPTRACCPPRVSSARHPKLEPWSNSHVSRSSRPFGQARGEWCG